MMLPVLLLLVSLMTTTTMAVTQCTDLDKLTNIQQGQSMTGYTFLSLELKGVMHCAQACLNRKRCKSFNLDVDFGTCELNLNTSSETGTLTSTPTHIYSDIEHWTTALSWECEDHTCSFSEMCQASLPIMCKDCSAATECGVCYPVTVSSGRMFQSYGCYHSSTQHVLSNLLVNLRSAVDWTDITTTIHDCASAAASSGYELFGIEYYGECYGGNIADANFGFPVSVTDCADTCWAGVGIADAMFVYQWI